MKKLVLYCLAFLVLVAGCTPYIYGVPQDRWDRMSDQERVLARRAYEREEAARQRAAEEQARREAFLREQERARKAEEDRLRRERIKAIHRGEGAYGELIRVRLQGGRLKVGDRHHRYQPVTFMIADGEAQEIEVSGRKGRDIALTATYTGGSLVLDGTGFPYDRSWGGGTLYTDTGTSGPMQLKGVDVFIEIVSGHPRYDREPPRIVILRDEEPPIVVHEHEPRPPIVHEKPRPSEPEKQRPDHRDKRDRPHQPAATVPPGSVEVAFVGGNVKVRGRTITVKPVAIVLANGESLAVALTGDDDRSLTVSYRDGAVLIGGPGGKGRSEVSLPFERDWQKGKVYRFSMKGKAALDKVDVRVTAK